MKKALKPFENLARNMTLNEYEDIGNIENMILDRKQYKFISEPETIDATLVHDFFANASERNGQNVMVKGRMVSFSIEAINEYYSLEPSKDE